MKFDIIIPFKDAINYLPRICNDLENQKYMNFHVYFVSDSSNDGSLAFLDNNFAFQHSVIHSDGIGPGSARNTGIKNSDGEYILFIDADDSVSENYVLSFYEKAISAQPDIIECMYRSIDIDGNVISGTNIENFIKKDDRFLSLIDGDIPRLSWGKAFKRDLIERNAAYFPDGIHNGEDHIFLLLAYKNDPRIEIIVDHLYHWMRNPTSLTNRLATEKTIEDFVKVAELKSNLLHDKTACLSPEISQDIILKFSRRTFKEARTLQGKVRNENNNADKLIYQMRELMLNSSELKRSIALIKEDNTSYWSDVM